MSNKAGPSKRRRLLPATELEDTASEGGTRQCSKCSHILPISHFASARRPSGHTKTCERCRNYDRQVPRQRKNPENIRGRSEYKRLANETPSQQERRRRTVRRIAPRPVSFVCYECRIPRPFPGARSTRDGVCYYCTLSSPTPLERQVKWCSRGEHAPTRDSFLHREIEYESCLEHEEHLPPSTSVPEPDTYHDTPPNSGIPPNRGLSRPVDTFSAATLAKRRRLPALSKSDYGLLTVKNRIPLPTRPKRQNTKLVGAGLVGAIEVEFPFQECLRCSRRSISRLKLNGAGICQPCRADEGSEVPRFFSENNLDPGGVPTHLEQLTDIEEILIARVQTAVNVFQVRGVQFQYRGHVAPNRYRHMPTLPIPVPPSRHDIRPNVTRALEVHSPPSREALYATNTGSTNAPSSYVLYGGVYG
ncbi:hypothetical protein E4U47_003511 [Claviceps purpurea]|nr:hypothetical protein E4U47_003511 [Claviceps purpurea]